MFKKCKILALVMLMIVSVDLMAQTNPVNKKSLSAKSNKARIKPQKEAKIYEEELGYISDSVAVLMGKPRDNWYFGMSAGLHMFSGNEKLNSARVNPITPQMGIRFGKWLTPCVAMSANFDFGFAKGQSTNNVYVPSNTGIYHKFKFFYYDLYGEVTLDWMNLACGYERGSRKKWHIQNTVGLGYAWQTGKAGDPNRVGKVSNYELSFHLGFNNDFRVNDRWVFFVEPKLAMIKGTWDYSPLSNTWGKMDFMPSLSVGAKLFLGKKVKHSFVHGSAVKMEEIRRIRRQVEMLTKENKITKQEDERIIDSLNNIIYELREKVPIPMQVLDVIVEDNLKYISVYFRIDEARIDYSTETSLKTFANRIKRSPAETKFVIISSADKATGTPESNMILTQKRCDAVYHVLVDKYGVDPDKLENHPIGGIDHYEPDDMNRMTLVVETNEKVDRILRRMADTQKD